MLSDKVTLVENNTSKNATTKCHYKLSQQIVTTNQGMHFDNFIIVLIVNVVNVHEMLFILLK